MKRTRTEIIIERDELFVLGCGKAQPAARGLCAACAAEVEMLPPEVAAAFAGTGPRHIYRLIETGCLHFVESANGAVLVCAASLGAAVDLQPVKSEGGAEND